MKDIIIFEDYDNINWFNNFKNTEINIIKEQFLNFPEKKYINLAIFQFDLFEYNDCEDYHYIINKLTHNVINRYPQFKIEKINCLKKNKLELVVNGKKYKKAFRINGSRFDVETLLDFLNTILIKNKIEEQFYLLSTSSDIQYPILITPSLLDLAKIKGIVAVG